MKTKKNIDVIVEARMTSSRLPGKVLKMGCGKPMLQHMIERLLLIPEVTRVIIATTVNPEDDVIVALAEKLKIPCYRGSEEDVLGRVVEAAEHFKTDVIVEITGDNPLVDPAAASEVIRAYIENEDIIDYVANDMEWTYPIGFNTRAFSTKLLAAFADKTNHPVDREHVVNYICKHPQEFRMMNIAAQGIYKRKDIRLTMDTEEDYQVIKAVFDALYPKNPKFTAEDIINFLDNNPAIYEINQKVVQRTYSYDQKA